MPHLEREFRMFDTAKEKRASDAAAEVSILTVSSPD
jgi:hypothetical protein